MSMKMVIFDLDGTLATQGEPVGPEASEVLLSLERRGIHVVLCSGKPTYYLVGIARQIGLKDVALIGETGFAVHVGTQLPPRAYHETSIAPETKAFLSDVKDAIRQHVPNVWFQPNVGSVTAFFYDEEGRARLQSLLAELIAGRDDVVLFAQPDCFDVTPGVTKADGIRWLLRWAGLTEADAIYVGDAENDQPAFDLIPCSIAIDPEEHLVARFRVQSLAEALQKIVDITGTGGLSVERG
jgi:HAD superfamily hydrolase (TIGR01484 family)